MGVALSDNTPLRVLLILLIISSLVTLLYHHGIGQLFALSDNGHLIGVGVGVEMLSTYPLEEAQLN